MAYTLSMGNIRNSNFQSVRSLYVHIQGRESWRYHLFVKNLKLAEEPINYLFNHYLSYIVENSFEKGYLKLQLFTNVCLVVTIFKFPKNKWQYPRLSSFRPCQYYRIFPPIEITFKFADNQILQNSSIRLQKIIPDINRLECT